MKFLIVIVIAMSAIGMASCGHKTADAKRAAYLQDSIQAAGDKAYKAHIAELSKLNIPLTGPASSSGDGKVTKGEPFKTYQMDAGSQAITDQYEKLNAKLEEAQKDSTTIYGALLTRFRLLKSQHKYLTATYSDAAHLLRYSSRISLDEKHEEECDFYFDNDTLIYFRERQTSAIEDQDLMTDDSYFLRNGTVAYAYRDEGTAEAIRDKMSVMSIKRYKLQGDLTGYVAGKFVSFKSDYDILLTQPLEPLIYPGKQTPQ